jgi:hypothetical protein
MQFLFAGALILSAAMATEGQPCPHPRIVPVVEIGDWIYDFNKPSAVGEPLGDGICELYCGIEVVDSSAWIPHCSSYSCRFTLQAPDGSSSTSPIVFGPRFDGMTQPTSVGTVCGGWSESMPAGRYHATLECESSSASFDFQVDRSHPAGFEISPSLWQGTNHCPRQPAFGIGDRKP